MAIVSAYPLRLINLHLKQTVFPLLMSLRVSRRLLPCSRCGFSASDAGASELAGREGAQLVGGGRAVCEGLDADGRGELCEHAVVVALLVVEGRADGAAASWPLATPEVLRIVSSRRSGP
eukprot:748010-Hanusia_phi.AAC.2